MAGASAHWHKTGRGSTAAQQQAAAQPAGRARAGTGTAAALALQTGPHPLVIAGNAIFTVLVVLTVAVGGALFIGKQRFEAPGPLQDDKWSISRAASALRTSLMYYSARV